MNIGTILDELGLDALSSGGTRGPDADPDRPSDDEEEEVPDEPEDEEPVSSGGLFGRGGDTEDDDLFSELADIEHDLDGVRNQVEQNSASINGLESEQQAMTERMELIEEHNATLLGVYDHLTEGINPFTGDWEQQVEQPDESESKFGVIPGPNDSPAHESAETSSTPDLSAETDERSGTEDGSGGVNPSADLAAVSPTAGSDLERESEPTQPPTPSDDGPYLTYFAATYATEVLIMEWLAMLVDRSGQEGALKALDHYDRIDWISEPIKRDLEVVLSGADCDPNTPPRSDLNTDVHDRSFKYIARLSQQAQLERTEQLR